MDEYDPYTDIRSYDELIFANILFLRGVLKRTPYHFGPIDRETNRLLDDLIDLNHLGFLTIDSQPSDLSVGKRPHGYYASQQKSYVTGYLHVEHVPAFLEYIRNQPFEYTIGEILPNMDVMMTHSSIQPSSTPIEDEYYCVTREMVADSFEEISRKISIGEWEYEHTRIPLTNPINLCEFRNYENITCFLNTKYVEVTVASKEFDQKLDSIQCMLAFLTE